MLTVEKKSCLKQRPLTRSELTAQEVRIPGDTIYREAPALRRSPVFSIYTKTPELTQPLSQALFLAIACIIIHCTIYLFQNNVLKTLLDFFVIAGIIKVSVSVIRPRPSARLITLTSLVALIITDITKNSS